MAWEVYKQTGAVVPTNLLEAGKVYIIAQVSAWVCTDLHLVPLIFELLE
jgi:hypothetical protein